MTDSLLPDNQDGEPPKLGSLKEWATRFRKDWTAWADREGISDPCISKLLAYIAELESRASSPTSLGNPPAQDFEDLLIEHERLCMEDLRAAFGAEDASRAIEPITTRILNSRWRIESYVASLEEERDRLHADHLFDDIASLKEENERLQRLVVAYDDALGRGLNDDELPVPARRISST